MRDEYDLIQMSEWERKTVVGDFLYSSETTNINSSITQKEKKKRIESDWKMIWSSYVVWILINPHMITTSSCIYRKSLGFTTCSIALLIMLMLNLHYHIIFSLIHIVELSSISFSFIDIASSVHDDDNKSDSIWSLTWLWWVSYGN